MSEQLANAIESYGRTLQGILQEQIKQRQPIVQRWTKDMYQYRNQYESSVDTGKSKVFVGYTRAKTDAWSAQMTDMLFPSDDKNYGISPTPVPQIAHLAKQPDSQSNANATNQHGKRANATSQRACGSYGKID